jgi:hypothetical protein
VRLLLTVVAASRSFRGVNEGYKFLATRQGVAYDRVAGPVVAYFPRGSAPPPVGEGQLRQQLAAVLMGRMRARLRGGRLGEVGAGSITMTSA